MSAIFHSFFNSIGKNVIDIFSCEYEEIYENETLKKEEHLLADNDKISSKSGHENCKCFCCESYTYLWQIITIDTDEKTNSIKMYEYIANVYNIFHMFPEDAILELGYLSINHFRIRPINYFGDKKFIFRNEFIYEGLRELIVKQKEEHTKKINDILELINKKESDKKQTMERLNNRKHKKR